MIKADKHKALQTTNLAELKLKSNISFWDYTIKHKKKCINC